MGWREGGRREEGESSTSHMDGLFHKTKENKQANRFNCLRCLSLFIWIPCQQCTFICIVLFQMFASFACPLYFPSFSFDVPFDFPFKIVFRRTAPTTSTTGSNVKPPPPKEGEDSHHHSRKSPVPSLTLWCPILNDAVFRCGLQIVVTAVAPSVVCLLRVAVVGGHHKLVKRVAKTAATVLALFPAPSAVLGLLGAKRRGRVAGPRRPWRSKEHLWHAFDWFHDRRALLVVVFSFTCA